jgi:hypothetical protein
MAGIRDKKGHTAFRPCTHMPVAGFPSPGEERAQLFGISLLDALGAAPPVMADYAVEILSLSPSESGKRESVLEALPSALERVGLALSLAKGSADLTYSMQDEREE